MVDLNDVRIRLDQLADIIVIGLKNRSRFPRNYKIYRADTVPIEGRSGISLFDFVLEGIESVHAQVGRYAYPDQFPLTENLPKPRIEIEAPKAQILRTQINTKNDLYHLYMGSLDLICEKEEDRNTFGETANCDVGNILSLNERLNLGRFVADYKFLKIPALRMKPTDKEAIELLRDRGREEEVVSNARKLAAKYELNQDATEEIFRKIIEATIGLECKYVRVLNGHNQ